MKATDDFRTRLPADVLIELEVEAKTRGCTMQEVARDVLVAWMNARLHAANLRIALRRAKGFRVESEGMPSDMSNTWKPDHD